MSRCNNYEIQKQAAMAHFLKFDQDAIIHTFHLKHDPYYLYLTFFNIFYRINRTTGEIQKSSDAFITAVFADFYEVLSIFDLLCHNSKPFQPSGILAPVNSLKGRPRTIAVETSFHETCSQIFDQNIPLFCSACEKMGGIPTHHGDIGYCFPVFDAMSIVLKFYRSDDEFPAQTTILWDDNTLSSLYYETTFYIAAFLMESLEQLCHIPSSNKVINDATPVPLPE